MANEPQRGNDFPAERFVLDGTVYAVDHFFGIVYEDGWTAGRDAFATGPDYWLSGGVGDRFVVADDLLLATDGDAIRAFRPS